MYKYPSDELLVIGITGTSGKSSTVYYLRQALESVGYTVGSLSTIDFHIAGTNKLNDQKMTMLGKTKIQKYVREMVDAGCDVAIIETTSEGRVQHRHRFINYDMMVLTNLYPEHIASHGSFEAYMQAKIDLFAYTAAQKRKRLDEKEIPKTALINTDHEEFDLLDKCGGFGFEHVYEFSAYKDGTAKKDTTWIADDVFYMTKTGDNESDPLFTRAINNNHDEINRSIALSVVTILGGDADVAEEKVATCSTPPGRVEYIEEANEYGFTCIVDYAFEPVAISALYATVAKHDPKCIIHVAGSTGGGRDASTEKAKLIAAHADIAIVTNEDPYDDDPMKIINAMADAMVEHGKVDNESLFRIEDRRDAIDKAIELAAPGDVVLVTGKGSEQAMVVKGGKKIPWDDRTEVRLALQEK